MAGAVWSYEGKRGNGSGLWHPHLHMVVLSEHSPDKFSLSAEWENITGDSKIVDVRPISQDDPASGFIEVFKYAVKFSDQPETDTVSAYQVLKGRRLLDCSGCFRGVVIPESLLDEPLTACHTLTCFTVTPAGATAAKGSGGGLACGGGFRKLTQRIASGVWGHPPCRTYAAQLARLNFFLIFSSAPVSLRGRRFFSLGGSRSLHRKCVPRVVCTLHSGLPRA